MLEWSPFTVNDSQRKLATSSLSLHSLVSFSTQYNFIVSQVSGQNVNWSCICKYKYCPHIKSYPPRIQTAFDLSNINQIHWQWLVC